MHARYVTLTIGIFLAALVVLAVVGRDETYKYKLVFADAGQLVKGNEVKAGGAKVGTVKAIELTDDNRAEIAVAIKKPYAPIGEGTEANIRASSLSGVANHYINLKLAPNSSQKLASGSRLIAERDSVPVDLDQLINSFDRPTRVGIAQIMRGFARKYQGPQAPRYARAAIEQLHPMLSNTHQLTARLSADENALAAVLIEAGRTGSTLQRHRGELKDLITNANITMAALGDRNQALDRALHLLPTTIRRGNSTFASLRNSLDEVDELVDASKPATKDLAAFLRRLRPVLSQAQPTVHELRRAVKTPGAYNDLTSVAKTMPALERAAKPAFRNGTAALRKAQPVLTFARPYTPELIGFLRDFGQSAAAYDANGHYMRIQPIFNAFGFEENGGAGTLRMLSAAERVPGLNLAPRRCPGAATQSPLDRSAPFNDHGRISPRDCDPGQLPPGL